MQSKSRQVLGAKSYVQKLRFKHRILPVEADLIQSLLDTATIITLPRQPGAFQFHGAAGADKRRYKLILKVVNNEQVWLSTLFRSDMATFRAATRKGLILKE